MSKPAVFGLVKNEQEAQAAISALETAGFIATDISVVSSSSFFDAEGIEQSGFAKTREVAHTNSTKAPEGATTGVAAGGALGGLAGWLVAIGALAVPGAGPFLAAGPIMGMLTGAALGATAGGLTGALIGYGIPEYEAKLFAGKLESGHILIGVHTIDSSEASRARTALENSGAVDIKVTREVEVK
jgi:tetrahydromethanopterin S-methyltransferase subunit C